MTTTKTRQKKPQIAPLQQRETDLGTLAPPGANQPAEISEKVPNNQISPTRFWADSDLPQNLIPIYSNKNVPIIIKNRV